MPTCTVLAMRDVNTEESEVSAEANKVVAVALVAESAVVLVVEALVVDAFDV